jgi:uncharacterized membrane protein YfcA
LAALGLLAGLASGFLGIGGGLIIVPGLVLLFSYPIKRAVGVSLTTAVLVALVAVLVELVVKGTNIHVTMALVIAAGSLLGSAIAARLLPRLGDRTLRMLFAGCLLVASSRMLMCARAGDGAALTSLSAASPLAHLLMLPIGVIAGVTSTLFGIGGGIVIVPCLSLFFHDVPFHAARATSLATILPTSAFGVYQHYQMGHVDLAVARQLIPTALAGAASGVVLVNFVASGPARMVFAIFLLLVAARLLVTGRTAPSALTAHTPSPLPGRA